MKLHSRPSTVSKKNKRVGRGYGSGKGGHTIGRGQKGQKSRGSGKIPAHFVGTSWVWFKRLPFMRGKSRFNVLKPQVTLTLSHLNSFKAGSKVDKQALYKQGLITQSELTRASVKIVATGQLDKKLNVHLPATKNAVKLIEKAGGECRAQHE